MNKLFNPLKVGDIEIKNRIVMAPLTRQRAGGSRTPNDLMKLYYTQRASAGLILTEATSIHPMGVGYKDSPGIWNQEQVSGWKSITEAVHEKGGKIFLQLWHVGRISDPMFLGGALPMAPSAIQPKGHVSQIRPEKSFVTPRELTLSEVKEVVQQYKDAAIRAKESGFDGVEIHAANGYLIDQFLQSTTNHRKDEYGGTIANRAKFLLEIVDELIAIWGAGRVGVHLAPACDAHDMGDENPLALFTYVASELGRRKLAFIFTRERQRDGYITAEIKKHFGGVVIANEGLDLHSANRLVEEGTADAVSWGKYFISNPDLVEKLRTDKPLTPFNPSTFYSGGPEGYTDYESF